MEKIGLAFEKFDNYNKQDPNVFVWDGDDWRCDGLSDDGQ